MQYPIDLTFKILAFGNQINIADAMGRTIGFIKQKAFRLKEDITIFTDESTSRPLYHIKADRIIDFSAQYHFTDAEGRPIGSVKRDGMKSLWKAHYAVFDPSSSVTPAFVITEENPWIKVADALLTEVPIVGMFHNYLLSPAYLLKRGSEHGPTVLRLVKRASLIGRRFSIERPGDIQEAEQDRALLGLFMVVLLERTRG